MKQNHLFRLLITLLLCWQTAAIAATSPTPPAPTRHARLLLAPTPVNVKVTVANANYVETISVCNQSGAPIPLTNLEFDFNYGVAMPSNIWGNPWVAWRVASQNGKQVVLMGGTPWAGNLPADPGCQHPLTIQFSAPPSNPAPTGPYVFKAEGGVGPGPSPDPGPGPSPDPGPTPDPGPVVQTGTLNVLLGAAPAGGLPNPMVTVTGPNTNQQKAVTWGAAWALPNLTPGRYNITGAALTANGQTYVADPVAATVVGQQTTNQAISYHATAATTTPVVINLMNSPQAQVPITLAGAKATINQTVANGAVLNLASDSYYVSSSVPGYTATATPNPLVVPINRTITISFTPVASGTGNRTINFINQCPFPVWFGFISGATPNRNGACNSDADCYPGSTCVNRGGGGNQCFWKTPVPANNNFQLGPNGGTNSVQIPIYKGGLNYIWSGAVAGRTNCTAAGCETADCGAGGGACPPGRGFVQPATQAEFTFGMTSPDYYDVEIINGVNIPVSMEPIGGPRNANDPYICGGGGLVNPTPGMGACSWNLIPPSVEYVWVRPGGNACNSNADCGGGDKCGLSFNPGRAAPFAKTCGKQLGYWTADQVCGAQNTFGAPFNCQQPLPPPMNNLNLTNLYGCTVVGSCYQPGANNTCCGCANWDKVGVNVPPGPLTQQCVNSNPTWMNSVLPTLRWLKQACPSVYTYPYDDMSSTFMCTIMKNNGGTQVNSVDYNITFCPGGKTAGIKQ